MFRSAGVVATVALGAAVLTGCSGEPPCVKSHTEVRVVPYFNGKTTTTKTMPVVVCDKRKGES
ncbi:hypothetical protein ACFYWP_01615 [Actinacidiphila glaucinigra]|uniref:hypothetical protein n=1 Tax=Actinacidiphila glaucinigra TaxID=235986 RepID=UPI0036AA1226